MLMLGLYQMGSLLGQPVMTKEGVGTCFAILRNGLIKYRIYFSTRNCVGEFEFADVWPLEDGVCNTCKGEWGDCEDCFGWGILTQDEAEYLAPIMAALDEVVRE